MPTHIYEIDSTGIFSDKFTYPDSVVAAAGLYNILGDDKPKLLTRSHITGFSLFYTTDSLNSLPTAIDFIFTLYPSQIDHPKFGDFDKNGITDMLFYNDDELETHICEYNDDINNFDIVEKILQPNGFYAGYAVGDFDQDNKTDIVYGGIDGEAFVIEAEGEHSYSLVWEKNIVGNHAYRQIAKTSGDASGDTVHAFWINPDNPQAFLHKKKYSSDDEWPSTYDNILHSSVQFRDVAVSSVSNDLFAVWSLWTGDEIYFYRQYDDVPLAPQNLTITESENNHLYLEWDANTEPDIDKYYIYRRDQYGGGWQYLNQTTSTYYEDETLTYCHAKPPSACQNERNFEFYVKAINLNSHISEPSSVVEAHLVGGAPDKISIKIPKKDKVFEHSLLQNYPNPFNPITQIDYSIKSAVLVSLKIYDMLGTEVVSLVNERKEPGHYSVEFNAANLPSGIYVYILSTGNFIDTKKLILLK